MDYKQILKDWEYLWKIGPADDMTGGYVDQEDLDKLLRNPTKKTACECLYSQIEYWFQVGPDPNMCNGQNVSEYLRNDKTVRGIARRNDISYTL